MTNRIPDHNEDSADASVSLPEAPAVESAPNSLERENALEHCRQNPEQWEVLTPGNPEEALDTLRHVQKLPAGHNDPVTGKPMKSIAVFLPDYFFPTIETSAEARNLVTELARNGRPRGIHVFLERSPVTLADLDTKTADSK